MKDLYLAFSGFNVGLAKHFKKIGREDYTAITDDMVYIPSRQSGKSSFNMKIILGGVISLKLRVKKKNKSLSKYRSKRKK